MHAITTPLQRTQPDACATQIRLGSRQRLMMPLAVCRFATTVTPSALKIVTCALLAVAVGAGCVTIYQPMRALQQPAVLDIASVDNFAGTHILVRCFASDAFDAAAASDACQKISTVLIQQGAETSTIVPRNESDDPTTAFEKGGPDLLVDIKGKNEHEETYPWLTGISLISATMIPMVEQYTFSMRVTVRDRDGAVLNEELMRARFTTYTGIAVWAVNYLLDWTYRSNEDALSGDASKKNFSRDYYQQVSQLTYNARVRAELLGAMVRPKRAARAAVVDRPASVAPPPTATPTQAPPAAPAAPAPTLPPAPPAAAAPTAPTAAPPGPAVPNADPAEGGTR